MPEIGLTGLPLDFPHSGTAVYARHLVPLLPGAAPDLSFRLFQRQASWRPPGVSVQRLSTPFAPLNRGQGIGARFDKLAWETVALPLASAARREALIHLLYFASPLVAAAPIVVTIHDLIPLILPGYHRSRQSALYSRFMALAARRAAGIITVSHHSKQDIVRILRVPEDRVRVTYEAVDERFRPGECQEERERVRRRYHLPDRFLLYTGGAERRKNIELLVRAWFAVRDRMRRQETKLVVVARFPPPDALYPDIPGLVQAMGLHDDVILVAEVDEEDKPALYRSALGFCFPSMYEGFGFTPLEAMASGLPVICSNAASLPEVVGDGGIQLPPGDPDSWGEAMVRLVESPAERRKLSERGIEKAARFDWSRTASQTVAFYREILGR